MGARRRCCCVCYNVFDAFSADGEDVHAVNPNWEECSGDGDWVIADGLLTTEDADAVIVFLPMVGWPVGIFNARIAISKIYPAINSIGGTAQMFAYVGSDGSPCSGTAGAWRLELEIITGGVGELRLYDPSDTLAGAQDLSFSGPYVEFWLCIGWDADLDWGEVVAGSPSGTGTPIWVCHQGMPSYYFALGNKSAAPDQVYYEETFYIDQYDHNPACPDCSIPCCCPCLEDELNRPDLTVSVVLGDDDCAIPGTETTTLHCAAISGECCMWTTAYGPLAFECELQDVEVELRMWCTGEAGYGITGRCEDYVMEMTLRNPSEPGDVECWMSTGGETTVTKQIVLPCTCIPLSLKFGPFYLWRKPWTLPPPEYHDCYCCKEFWLVVTE